MEVGGGKAPRRPAVRAILLGLRSIDTPEPIGDAAKLQRVAIGDGLRIRCGRS